jgi:hypothetical protein
MGLRCPEIFNRELLIRIIGGHKWGEFTCFNPVMEIPLFNGADGVSSTGRAGLCW